MSIANIMRKKLGLQIVEDLSKEQIQLNKESSEKMKAYFEKLKQIEVEKKVSAVSPKNVISAFLYNANKILEIQNKVFEIDQRNEDFINFLVAYFSNLSDLYEYITKEMNFECLNKLDKKKGLLIISTYGTGKTLIMKAFSKSQIPNNNFSIKSANAIVEDFEESKGATENKIKNYSFDIDDFGAEKKAFKDVEVLEKLIEKRYNQFTESGLKTHMTSNLTIQELKDKYGLRAFSRLKEMQNIIIYHQEDRRF